MTRFFYDFEFHEDGRTIDPISVGMVADTGEEFYAINAHADWERISRHEWLAANVLPHLPGQWHTVDERGEKIREWQPDFHDQRVMPKVTLRDRLRRFIEEHGYERGSHELWAWYGAYDHVALAQLWGKMLDLPGCIPMYTNDLKTLVGRREVPVPHGAEHDALADARWNRDVFTWWQRQTGEKRAQERNTYKAEGVLPCALAWAEMSDYQREVLRNAMRSTPLAYHLDKAAGIKRS